MLRWFLFIFGLQFTLGLMAAESSLPVDDERRLFQEKMLLGQIRFFTGQGDFYQALQLIADNNLLSERQIRERLNADKHAGTGHQTLAEIELAFRMNRRAGNAVREVLDANIELDKRNRAAYELAQIYYDKHQYDYARFALQLIRGEIEYPFDHDVAYLHAMIDARTGHTERAIEALDELNEDERTFGFASFNLAHLLMQTGETVAALSLFDEIGQIQSEELALRVLADKSNLLLGYRYLNAGDDLNTVKYLSRVRLNSVFTSRALLGLAWSQMKLGDLRAALVPWTHLNQHKPVDAAVLESYIAVPYIYGQLGLHGKAATLYETAIDTLMRYQQALEKANAAIDEGVLIPVVDGASEREPLIIDELIAGLLASKQYRESWYNYRDLQAMIGTLAARRDSLEMTAAMLSERSNGYEAYRLQLDQHVGSVDVQIEQVWQQQRDIEMALVSLGSRLGSLTADTAVTEQMYANLDALVINDVTSGLADTEDSAAPNDGAPGLQLEQLHSQSQGIERSMQKLEARRQMVIASLGELTSYQEFQLPVASLIEKTDRLMSEMQDALGLQQEHLKHIAGTALQQHIDLIISYKGTARYELAKSHDILVNGKQGK